MFDEDPQAGAPTPNPAEDWTERHVRVLQQMTDLVAELAVALQKQALVQLQAGEVEAGQKTAATVTKIVRCVRQTMALEARTRRDAIDLADKDRVQRLAESERLRTLRKERVAARAKEAAGLLDTVMEREYLAAEFPDQHGASIQDCDGYGGPDDPVELFKVFRENLHERLKDPEDELADLPMGVLLARLCKSIELIPNWTKWPGRRWAIEAAREMNLPPPSHLWGGRSYTTDDEAQPRQGGGSLGAIPTVTPP
ncbi:hypothetical protein BH11PSE2_BH11PSE2_16580 [soil metagenome]